MKTAIYPGSFDPITLGHLDIIRRSAPCFDRLFVCVMVNCDKKPMFSPEQRLELIRRSVADLLLPASPAYQHFSSTMVREMIRYGQPLEKYVPAPVAEELKGR